MTPNEHLSAWRAEILAEAEQLEREMPTAQREFDLADRAYRAEVDRWDEVRAAATRGLDRSEGMPAALYDRVETGRDEALRPLSRNRATANARLQALQSQIADRRLALRQIDAALEPAQRAKVVELAPRPKPPAVQFDTIVGAGVA